MLPAIEQLQALVEAETATIERGIAQCEELLSGVEQKHEVHEFVSLNLYMLCSYCFVVAFVKQGVATPTRPTKTAAYVLF